MKAKKKNELTFEYKISDNYTVFAVNGVYGGINPSGEILMHFFNERTAIPQKETYEILKDGSLGAAPLKSEKKDAIIRNILFGISINPTVARSIATWLMDKADKYDARITKADERKLAKL